MNSPDLPPDMTELQVGDVFAGSRWWVGDSGSRPTFFVQVVRCTPRRVYVVPLGVHVVEEFNGGRASQDGYWKVAPAVRTGAGLDEAIADRSTHLMGRIRAEARDDEELPDPVPLRLLRLRIGGSGYRDVRFTAWDGEPTISS